MKKSTCSFTMNINLKDIVKRSEAIQLNNMMQNMATEEEIKIFVQQLFNMDSTENININNIKINNKMN